MDRSRDREDIIVSLRVAALLDKLSSEALRDFGSVWRVQRELDALSEVLENIQGLLNFAEHAQTKNRLVKRCLRNLRDVAFRAEDILDEFIYEACREKDERYHQGGKIKEVRSFHFNLNESGILRNHEIGPLIKDELINKLEKIEEKLEDHHPKGLEIRQSYGVNHEMDTRPKSVSRVDDESGIFGREEEVNEIKNKLVHGSQNQVSAIAIVGIGGLGKTTLAQSVYNHPDVKKHFDKRAWACVSTDFDAVRVISAILESLNEKNPKLSNLEPLQRKLENELRGKRCLIVLDDVWTEKERDWEALRVPLMKAGEGSRIIVTTRSTSTVSSMMHPDLVMHTRDLQILSDEKCWSIMERCISSSYKITSSLEAEGRKMASKCKGLPLAARTLAGLLRSGSSDLSHWKEVSNSSLWNSEDERVRDLPAALSLSYYFLPTCLKQCFACCSLFPEDHLFKKEHLVELWMAEGFIRSNIRSRSSMKDKGGQYFDDLLHRSFFQRHSEDKECFVMHDLVHDLAEAVSGDVYGRYDSGESKSKERSEARYLSMCSVDHYMNSNNHHHHHHNKGRHLSTLIYFSECLGFNLSVKSFGGYLRYLRVLDLSASRIEMLPDDIENLKYLHYINLSYTGCLKRLPETLCNLYNLHSLILHESGICELPRGMKYLCNHLQHLDLIGCFELKSMPQGIGRLTNLKTLNMFVVSKDDDHGGCGKLRELKELSQLEGELEITGLQNVMDPQDAREADLMNNPKVDDLTLNWYNGGYWSNQDVEDRVEVLEALRPHTELKRLLIYDYNGLTFPRWLMIDLPSYNNLISLSLGCCRKCRVLPPVIGELPLLENLSIWDMDELEEWPSSSSSNSSSSRRDEETETEFPSLLKLSIDGCPKLKMLPQPLLSSPRLCKLEMVGCESLRSLPAHQGLSKLTSLNDLHLGYEMEGLVQFLDKSDRNLLPPNLIRLEIGCHCKSLRKAFITNLSSLQHLTLSGSCHHYNISHLVVPANVKVTRGGD